MPRPRVLSSQQVIGDLTISMARDAKGDLTWDFCPDTIDPVGLTAAFIELVCGVVPKQPDLLLHVAHTCQSREHMREVLSQLSDEARATLGGMLEPFDPRPRSEDEQAA
jgi:hypothetical protein